MRTAAVYCRISRDPGQHELGVQRQEQDCRALCERDAIAIVEVLVDNDISAYSKKKRPGYQRVLDLLAAGEINTVVAWHPDRLTRHPRELEDLIDALEAAKATVRTVQAGEYDLSTPSGRQVARIVGAIARGESEHKGARLRRKHDELAAHGKLSGGGTRPFGYKDDRVTVIEREAKIIREMTRRVLAGESLYAIAVDLQERGVPSATGARWTKSVVRRMLMSGRIAGLRVHRSGTFKATWPAIVSEDDHRRLVAVLSDNNRRMNHGGRRYLLTGFTVCGVCGAKLVARPRSDKRKAMVCSTGPGFYGCGKLGVIVDPLDDLVTEAVLTRLDSPALAALISDHQTDDDGDDLDALRQIEARTAELGEMWAAGELDRASWQAARRKLDADREAISERVRQRSTPTVIAPYAGHQGALRKAWPNLSIDQRRAVLGAVVDQITIGPAVRGRNFFDADRVSIKWRA